jgi:hypothetical protein
MSCSLTVEAVRSREKTVTRRDVDTWKNLRRGDRLVLVEKAMGLPKGAKQVVLTTVEVVDVRVEPIGSVTREDAAREGFPHLTAVQFIRFWLVHHGHSENDVDVFVRRIEWRYLDEIKP